MTIYAVHQHNGHEGSPKSPLEAFPSVERASVALQLRSRKQESATFYASDRDAETWLKEPVAFPDADLTGFMLVWRCKSSDPQPDPETDTPHEVWRMKQTGGVVKRLWAEDELGGGEPSLPSAEERRSEALKVLASLPVLEERFLDGVNPVLRRALRDLVQDNEAELAILRLMQAVEQQSERP